MIPRPAVIHWIIGADGSVVAEAVGMLDFSRQNVSDGLDASVRMPRKAGEIVFGNVVAEVVEQFEYEDLVEAIEDRPALV